MYTYACKRITIDLSINNIKFNTYMTVSALCTTNLSIIIGHIMIIYMFLTFVIFFFIYNFKRSKFWWKRNYLHVQKSNETNIFLGEKTVLLYISAKFRTKIISLSKTHWVLEYKGGFVCSIISKENIDIALDT